jgi:hypothetical protein
MPVDENRPCEPVILREHRRCEDAPLVIASLVVQGWTVGSATRLLGFARRG